MLRTALESRKASMPNSQRWAGRTSSHAKRRKPWVPPDLTKMPQRLNSITQYSDKNYVIGNSSKGRLRTIADRLTGRRFTPPPAGPFEKEADGPQLPWDLSSPTFTVEAANTSGSFELEGEGHWHELVGSVPGDLSSTDSRRPTGLEPNEDRTVNDMAGSVDTLVEEGRVLEDMRRAAEETALRAEDADVKRAIKLSQQEAKEQRVLESLERKAEDAALARAIEESRETHGDVSEGSCPRMSGSYPSALPSTLSRHQSQEASVLDFKEGEDSLARTSQVSCQHVRIHRPSVVQIAVLILL